MIIFGNGTCPNCTLETRVMIEKGIDKSFVLLGDKLRQTVEEKIECDYCQETFEVFALEIDGVLSAILNKKEYEKHIKKELKIEKAQQNQGIEQEKQKRLNQLKEEVHFSFKSQPFKKNREIRIDRENWKVKKSYKKENQEKDVLRRLLEPFEQEYCYIVENLESNKEKWLIVKDIKKPNSILQQEGPTLKENEILHDVTETNFKTKCIYKKETENGYEIKAYQQVSGVRLVMKRKEEDEIEIDVFEDSLEKAMEKLEKTIMQEEL